MTAPNTVNMTVFFFGMTLRRYLEMKMEILQGKEYSVGPPGQYLGENIIKSFWIMESSARHSVLHKMFRKAVKQIDACNRAYFAVFLTKKKKF